MDTEGDDGRHGPRVAVFAFVVALAAMALSDTLLPETLSPSFAFALTLGLLFGPWGALGATVAGVLLHALQGMDPWALPLDAAVLLLSSYLPYHLWYSILTRVRPKSVVLGTVQNMAKLLVVLAVASLAYTALDHTAHAALYGQEHIEILALDTFLLTLTSSIVTTLGGILATWLMGIRHWTPAPRIGTNRLDAVDVRVFDGLLVAGMAVTVLATVTEWAAWVTTPASIVLLALYCLRPTMTVRSWEVRDDGSGEGSDRTQVSDRIITMFCGFGAVVLCVVATMYMLGLLDEIPLMRSMAEANAGFAGGTVDQIAWSLSLLTYLSATCVGQYVIVLAFLRFIERSLVEPIKVLSGAARDFIISDSAISADDVEERCARFSARTDEVGELSRSLGRLTRDVADYVQDIESLRRDKQAYRAELAIARQIQMGLIPKNFDSVEGTGITIAGLMDTAKSVGGDLYDFMVLPHWRVAVFIGDVSGKGVPAALFMSRAKALMEDHAERGSDPGTSFYEINNALAKENTQLLFVSSWHGVIDTVTGVVEFANAGHCPPLIWRAETGAASFVEMRPHPVLGVIPNTEYKVETLTMGRGDRLLIYTDGVTEANADYQGFYGSERLRGVFEDTAGLSPADQLRVIREDVKEFVGNAEQFDDMTMLLIRFDGRSTATGLRAAPDDPAPRT